MLTNIVKISNVTNLSDARYCAGMGVEMLGFSIDQSSRNYVSPKKFGEISSWIAGVKFVIETSEVDTEKIKEQINNYAVDFLEINEPGLIYELKSTLEIPVILRVDVDTYTPEDFTSICDRYGMEVAYFLLDSDSGASLNSEWLALIKELGNDYPLIIGFGIENASTVTHLTNLNPTIGFGLKGSEEIRPGFKDFGSMMDILEVLEEA